MRLSVRLAAPAFGLLVVLVGVVPIAAAAAGPLDSELAEVLRSHGFTGRMESTLESRLGRRVDPALAELGRLLWFDTVTGLHGDNACGGCHAPSAGFGDTQPIAIGIDNNGVVGPGRRGPRNQRRAPIVINNVFYPNLMWNSRFAAVSRDPFDNRQGFSFPQPEGLTLSALPHLLVAQAFIPPTERNEVAGFDFVGDNTAIRAEVLRRLSDVPEYRRLFARSFPEVRAGAPITFEMFGRAIAEFEFTLAFTDAPVDRYARGERVAMTASQKRGALLFFGKAGCVSCHGVSGSSNEMFSDFETHVIGVPQIVPDVTNSVFDGPNADEDFGLEQVTGNPADRYRFRTSPLRNVGIQPTFFHNGSFTSLREAIRHHLDPVASARSFTTAHLPDDLRRLGPIESVLERLDPRLREPIRLEARELEDLLAFVGEALLDPRALPARLARLIPERLPSGRERMAFEGAPGPSTASGRSASPLASRPAAAVVLGSPWPNPSQGPVALSLAAPTDVSVDCRVLDMAGRTVRRLEARDGLLVWDARNASGRLVPPGIYLVQARHGASTSSRRVVLTP